MSNTTVARILAVAPDLSSKYAAQVSTVTVTAANLKTTVTIDGVAYHANAGATVMTKAAIADELAAALNAALFATLTAVAVDGVITLTAITVGVGFVPVGTTNCSVLTTTANSDVFAMVMADAVLQCSYDVYGDRQEEAQRYLCAHLLTCLATSTGDAVPSGPMTKEKVGNVEVWYSDSGVDSHPDITRYDSTEFGRRFQQIIKMTVVPVSVY